MQLEADYGLRGRTHQYPQALMSWRGPTHAVGGKHDALVLVVGDLKVLQLGVRHLPIKRAVERASRRVDSSVGWHDS